MALSFGTRAQVVYPAPGNTSNLTWLDAPPGIIPTSSWARAVNGGVWDLPVKVASFRASNLQGAPCVDIFVPDHPWMRAHGWGASHAGCPEGGFPEGRRQVYAFHSYFPQAFAWDVDASVADSGNTRTLTAEGLRPAPPGLPAKFGELEKAWAANHDGDDALWSYGRTGSWDQQSAMPDLARCFVLVIAGAPIVACNLTEGKAVHCSTWSRWAAATPATSSWRAAATTTSAMLETAIKTPCRRGSSPWVSCKTCSA